MSGVRVLLFGPLRDAANWRERVIEPAPPRLSALKAILCADQPALGRLLNGPSVKAAVNKIIVMGDPPLERGAEVAFLPPMSGG